MEESILAIVTRLIVLWTSRGTVGSEGFPGSPLPTRESEERVQARRQQNASKNAYHDLLFRGFSSYLLNLDRPFLPFELHLYPKFRHCTVNRHKLRPSEEMLARVCVLVATFFVMFSSSALAFVAPAVRMTARSGGALRMMAADAGEKANVAIVTGASRGIGKACALELAQHGVKVVVNYASSADSALAVVEEIKALGSEAVAIKVRKSLSERYQGNHFITEYSSLISCPFEG